MSLQIKQMLRSLLYPGLDLHVYNRGLLKQFWRQGARDVLDAGSGNGYFSWLAYSTGANVLALNFNNDQVKKARDFLIGYRQADPSRLRFEQYNLYDLPKEKRQFDEIICYEVIEHLRQDQLVVDAFFKVLKPGGVLHLCCPNRLHPRHQAEILDLEETGGHYRAGYTESDYREMLEPLGFEIDKVAGIGPSSLYYADAFLRALRTRIGDFAALPFFPFLLPFAIATKLNPPVPFSIYVRAVKPL